MTLVVDKARGSRESKTTGASQLRNILFATDFSPVSEIALPYATAICRRFGGTLHAAHVLSDASLLLMAGGVDYVSMGTLYEDAQNEAMDKLKQLSASYGDIAHCNYVRHGQVWTNLALLVEENKIDLIVVGTHGRTGFGKLLLGSVAEDILRHAPCPVLTVGPNIPDYGRMPVFSGKERDLAPIELELRQIVFATNFAQNAALVAQSAVSLAEEFRARLTLLHVMEDYTQLGSRPGPIEDSMRRLRELIPEKLALQYLPEPLVEFGSAPERILKIAEDREADLIVMGTRANQDPGATHLPWTTTHHVIAKAKCPVLTVRG